MSNVKVGDKVEILKIGHFNRMLVTVGDVATIFSIDRDEVYLKSDRWMYTQQTQTYREGEYWRRLPTTSSTPIVEPPTITSEPFITIKGVEVGSSLERALNLVVAVYNGDSVRVCCYEHYGCTNKVHYSYEYTRGIVRTLDTEGLDWYILKSEDEAIKAKNIKESFDKEIQELENKLQELKTKQGD